MSPKGIDISTNERQRFILQLWNKPQNLAIQIADNLLIINTLKTYSTWNVFKKSILYALEQYKSVAKPAHIQRIILKYINKLDMGEKHSYQKLQDTFKLLPLIPNAIEGDATSLQMIVEIPYHNGREILAIQQATLKPEDNKRSPVLFELNYILLHPNSVSFEDFEKWIEQAHLCIENAFESGLTDKTKEKFD